MEGLLKQISSIQGQLNTVQSRSNSLESELAQRDRQLLRKCDELKQMEMQVSWTLIYLAQVRQIWADCKFGKSSFLDWWKKMKETHGESFFGFHDNLKCIYLWLLLSSAFDSSIFFYRHCLCSKNFIAGCITTETYCVVCCAYVSVNAFYCNQCLRMYILVPGKSSWPHKNEERPGLPLEQVSWNSFTWSGPRTSAHWERWGSQKVCL